MEDDLDIPKNNNGGGAVELAPFYKSRVKLFFDMYEPSDMDHADEYFDDIKLREFFGCESRDFTTDGLPSYREELIGLAYPEYPCPWLHGRLVFPVKNRFCEAEEL